MVREKEPGKLYVLSIYKYYTHIVDHYLIYQYSNYFVINDINIYTNNLECLIYYLSHDKELCKKIDGNEDVLCKLVCRYK